RNLLSSTLYFSHSLGPSTGRVRHQCDVIAHVPVVLRNRNSSVDAGLSRGNGHVRSIRDQYRPVHDGLAASRVHKLRKRFQHFRHLVSSLAAPHVDNDGGVSPLCELLLRHGVVAYHWAPTSNKILVTRDGNVEDFSGVLDAFGVDYLVEERMLGELH